MNPTLKNEDVEAMEKAGCPKCVHWAECLKDALDQQGFSTLDLGKNCKGYDERK